MTEIILNSRDKKESKKRFDKSVFANYSKSDLPDSVEMTNLYLKKTEKIEVIREEYIPIKVLSTSFLSRKSKVLHQLNERKAELLKSIEALETGFDDSVERHIQYFRFKEELKKIREPLDLKHRDLLRLITGCIDATKNIEAEELDLKKVEAFKKVIKEIRENIECSTVNSLLSVLISAGLKPIPDLKYYEPIQV